MALLWHCHGLTMYDHGIAMGDHYLVTHHHDTSMVPPRCAIHGNVIVVYEHAIFMPWSSMVMPRLFVTILRTAMGIRDYAVTMPWSLTEISW